MLKKYKKNKCIDCGKTICNVSTRCKGCAGKIRVGNFSENVSYKTLHQWVRRNFPVPKICPSCGTEKKVDACNISGKYKRELSDWKYQCRKCHMKEDRRLFSFNKNRNQMIKDGDIQRNDKGQYIKQPSY